jgi:hypothetical protein
MENTIEMCLEQMEIAFSQCLQIWLLLAFPTSTQNQMAYILSIQFPCILSFNAQPGFS